MCRLPSANCFVTLRAQFPAPTPAQGCSTSELKPPAPPCPALRLHNVAACISSVSCNHCQGRQHCRPRFQCLLHLQICHASQYRFPAVRVCYRLFLVSHDILCTACGGHCA